MEAMYCNNMPDIHYTMHNGDWSYCPEAAAEYNARPNSATRNHSLMGIGGGMSFQPETMHGHSPFLENLEIEASQFSIGTFHSEQKTQDFALPRFEHVVFTGDHSQYDSPQSDDSSQNCDTFSSYSHSDELHAHAMSHRLSIPSSPQMNQPYYSQGMDYQEDWNFFPPAQSPQLPPGGGSSCGGISMNVVQQIPDQLYDQNQEFPRGDVYSDADGEGESDHEYPTPAHSHIHEPSIAHAPRRTTRHAHYDVVDSTSESFDPEEEEDADYNPRSGARAAKTRRASGARRASQSLRRGSNGMSAGRINKNKKKTTTAKTDRPFPCPLSQYGCKSTFKSKNEWKRHVSTQHIKLGLWRCDMCLPSDPANPSYNDFNRKDLFTQHLRRMHRNHPHTASATNLRDDNGDLEISEEAINAHQDRCYVTLRANPAQSTCLFSTCTKAFSGEASWEEHMEHVGAHMERDRKAGKPAPACEDWRVDESLREYLLREGLVDWDGTTWSLGDGAPRREEY